MTGFLKALAMPVAGIIVFGSVCEMIMPDTAYKKYIHLAIGLILILALFSPFSKGIPKLETDILANDTYEMDTYRENKTKSDIYNIYKTKLCNKIKNDIEKSTDAKVEVVCEISDDEENFGEIKQVKVKTDESAETTKIIKQILKNDYGLSEKDTVIEHFEQRGR